ncbi:CHRD domain-containing protein [Pontibacter burrus]|uniref:CHRD domain-containing protein n=1 Tax=Pontibacter burrus TaxID=2704466 RepID=A0A6B3LYQ9_9BACT|nr:CHRD domain-containing protein [Pontibacter burrus]NEM99476.1 CHRD domain-containing protein [Pontibacter burrus]
MKTTLFRSLRLLAMCMSLLAFTVACDDDDDDDLPIIDDDLEFENIALSGANERPKVITDGTGTFNGEYDPASNTLTYSLSWTLGEPTDSTIMMHFHGPADTTTSAGIQIPILGHTRNYTGTFSGSATLTDQQEQQLEDGLWYVNIHSGTHRNGELRGQLLED